MTNASGKPSGTATTRMVIAMTTNWTMTPASVAVTKNEINFEFLNFFFFWEKTKQLEVKNQNLPGALSWAFPTPHLMSNAARVTIAAKTPR